MNRLRTWGLTLATVAALGGMGGFLVVRGLRADAAPAAGAAKRSIQEWAEALTDPSAAVRREAAAALSGAGPAAASAMRALLDAIRDDDVMVRAHAVVALSRLGPVAHRRLIEGLGSAEVLVRRGTAGALALQGSAAV